MDEEQKKQLGEFLGDFTDYWYIVENEKKGNRSLKDYRTNRPLRDLYDLSFSKSALFNIKIIPNGGFAKVNNFWEKIVSSISSWNSDLINTLVLRFYKRWFEIGRITGIVEKLPLTWKRIVWDRDSYYIFFVLSEEAREWLPTFDKGGEIFKAMQNIAEYYWADSRNDMFKINSSFSMPFQPYLSNEWKEETELIYNSKYEYVTKEQLKWIITFYRKYIVMKKQCNNDMKWRLNETIITLNAQWVTSLLQKLHLDIPNLDFSKDWKIVYPKFIGELKDNPCWDAYEFLWSYADWKRIDIEKLIRDYKWESIAEDLDHLSGPWFSIDFEDTWTVLQLDMVSMKWDITHWRREVFKKNVKLVWRWVTKMAKFGEWEEQTVYMFNINWVERLIRRAVTKNEFNRLNQWQWIFFYWRDDQLWRFLEILDSYEWIPELKIYNRSWFYNDSVVLWDRTIIGWSEFDKLLLQQPFRLTNAEQISVKEYFDFFCKCYKEIFSVPLFLAALSLGGMNLWHWAEVNPALLISWFTGCGKSTVAGILKRMLWYWANEREMALPGVTPQPLKQAASDNAILFLEELTNAVNERTEELLRNIVNRDKVARWGLDQNYEFYFRSPLWINWERTLKNESLNNRFCSFVMSKEHWKPNSSQLLSDIQKYTAYKDIYATYLKYADDINELLAVYKQRLLKADIPPRPSDVWSYIFVVNDIFDLGVDEEELIWYVKYHLNNVWLLKEPKNNWDPIKELCWLISVGLYKNTVMLQMDRDIINNIIDLKVIYVDDETYQQNRGSMHSRISAMNKALWEERVTVDFQWLSLKLFMAKDCLSPKADDSISVRLFELICNILEQTPSARISPTISSIFNRG